MRKCTAFLLVSFFLFSCVATSLADDNLENFLSDIISSDSTPDTIKNVERLNGKFIVDPDEEYLKKRKALQGTVDFEKVRDLNWREKDFSLARRVGMFDISGVTMM